MLESDCSIKLGKAGARLGVPDLFIGTLSDVPGGLLVVFGVVGDLSPLEELGPAISFKLSFGCLVKLANDDKSTSAG